MLSITSGSGSVVMYSSLCNYYNNTSERGFGRLAPHHVAGLPSPFGLFQLGNAGCMDSASWATLARWCQCSLHWCLQYIICKHRHKHACNSNDRSKHCTRDYL